MNASRTNADRHLDDVLSNLAALAADLEGRALEVRDFVKAVREEREKIGPDSFLDPRSAFFYNVQTVTESSARDTRASGHRSASLRALVSAYAEAAKA